MSNYDKPFLSYDEQINKIRNKNISIRNENRAKMILQSVSYYTLINGYKSTFLLSEDRDTFIDGIDIDLLYYVHLIDNTINSIIFKNILYVERSLKTKIAYLIGRDYGVNAKYNFSPICDPDDYLDKSHYSNPRNYRTNTLNELRDAIVNCRKESTTFYYKKNKNHIPPWILVNDIPFGTAIKWYRILKPEKKDEICDQLIPFNLTHEEKREFLIKSLELLRKYRNGIAHGNKTFAFSIGIQIPKNSLLKIVGETVLSSKEYNYYIGKNDLFTVILVLMILIDDPFVIRILYKDFKNAFFDLLGDNKKPSGNFLNYIFDLPLSFDKKLNTLVKIKKDNSVWELPKVLLDSQN